MNGPRGERWGGRVTAFHDTAPEGERERTPDPALPLRTVFLSPIPCGLLGGGLRGLSEHEADLPAFFFQKKKGKGQVNDDIVVARESDIVGMNGLDTTTKRHKEERTTTNAWS